MLVAMAVFLVLTAMLGSLSGTDRADRAEKPPPSPPQGVVQATGRLPADEIVRARVGDVVVLDAATKRFDRVRIAGLGFEADAAPGAPARLEFVAGQPGRFAVVTELGGARLGTLVVSPAG